MSTRGLTGRSTVTMMSTIADCLAAWHSFTRSRRAEELLALLADDVVFTSPVVFKPQDGKAITFAYLWAAMHSLGDPANGFRYLREIVDHDRNAAVLEFETTLDGVLVNGVDMIACDDAGKIVDFKVMVRPRRGVDAVHQAMARMLDELGSPPPA